MLRERPNEKLARFESSYAKLARAKHHIDDLAFAIDRFREKRPYNIVIEADPEPGYKIHKLRLTDVSMVKFSVVIGDAVTNIRVALDHALYACATYNGYADPIPRTCSFPCSNSASGFDNEVNGRTSVPEEIRACLRRFGCHKGGHDALWELNRMCNADKHALITPAITGYRNYGINFRSGGGESPKNIYWDRVKNEIELFRTNTDPEYDLTITLDIAFDGTGLLALHPVVPTLNTLANMTHSIVGTLEAEMRLLFPNVV